MNWATVFFSFFSRLKFWLKVTEKISLKVSTLLWQMFLAIAHVLNKMIHFPNGLLSAGFEFRFIFVQRMTKMMSSFMSSLCLWKVFSLCLCLYLCISEIHKIRSSSVVKFQEYSAHEGWGPAKNSQKALCHKLEPPSLKVAHSFTPAPELAESGVRVPSCGQECEQSLFDFPRVSLCFCLLSHKTNYLYWASVSTTSLFLSLVIF